MTTENKSILTAELKQAVQTIKGAILQSQSRAVRMISGTQTKRTAGLARILGRKHQKNAHICRVLVTIPESLANGDRIGIGQRNDLS